METVLVALIASVVGPGLLAIILGHQRKSEKAQDYERQDNVAAEALRQQNEAANALRAEQDAIRQEALEVARIADENQRESDRKFGENNRRLEAVARVAAESQAATVVSLNDIKILADKTHTLVNSNLTNEMQGRLDSYRDKLVLLEEIHDLKKAGGLQPTAAAMSTISDAKSQIDLLQAQMDERARQTDIAEAQANDATEANHPQRVTVVNLEPIDVTETTRKDKE